MPRRKEYFRCELTGQTNCGNTGLALRVFAAVLAVHVLTWFPWHHAALANPVDPNVVAGSATVHESGKTLEVHQASDKAIIDWRSFSIAADEITRFIQPSASSIALNRVTGADPSHIFGTLTANGRVMLVNPNGILFGPNSRIDVAGLVATTTGIRNTDFLAGNYEFSLPSLVPGAGVVNEGTITVADTGFAALVAPHVRNAGVINARLGRVTLGAAEAFALDLYGDNLVSFRVGVRGTPVDGKGNPIGALVDNSGAIHADSGVVTLAASSIDGIVRSVVNTDGIIQANTIEQHANGRIVLGVEGTGEINIAGDVSATGGSIEATSDTDIVVENAQLTAETVRLTADADETRAADAVTGGDALITDTTIAVHDIATSAGGTITITGDRIALLGETNIEAFGGPGGGEVLVGGNFQGKGLERNARHTHVGEDVTIKADAAENGDGGRVVVWANETTRFFGSISATGGLFGGDGGFAEVSGKNYLDYRGVADLRAPLGAVGTLLLDPNNITIDNVGPDANISGVSPFTTTDDSAVLLVSTIETALGTGNVVVTTASAGANAQAGDVTVSNAITAPGTAFGLTLNAINDLNINAAINMTGGTGGLTLNADSDANGTGAFNLGAVALSTTNAAISISANKMDLLGTINSGAAATTLLGTNGAAFDLGSVGAAAGNTVELSNAELQTIAAGTLTIGDGTAGAIAVSADVTPGSTAGADVTTFALVTGSTVTGTAGGIIETNLAMTAAGTVNFTDINSDVAVLAVSNAGQAVTYRDASGLDIGSVAGVNGVTGSAFTLTAAGAITDSQAIIVPGITSITAGGANNITLNTATNDFGTLTFASGNLATIVDNNAITMDTLNLSGGLSVSANNGITLGNFGTTTGITTLNADADNNGSGTFTVSSAISTVNSALTVTANKMALAGGTLDSGAAATTLLGSNGASFDLGSATDVVANTVELSNAELQTLTASQLNIGDGTAGSISVSGDVTPGNTAGAAVTTVHLTSSTFVGATAGGIIETNLAITAGGAITFSDLQQDIGTLAAFTSTGNIAYTDANAFSVSTVDGVTGVDTNSGTLSLTATTNNITVVNTAAANDIDASGAITLTATADEATITTNATADIESTGGTVTLNADKMALSGTITNAGRAVTLQSANAGDAINLGSATDVAGNTLELSGVEIQGITAGTLTIGSSTVGNITVEGITAANSNNATTVVLDATANGSSITFATTASTFNALTANADDGIAINVAVNTDTGALTLEGDADNAADANDDVAVAAGLTLASIGLMTVDATSGGITGAGALTLNGDAGVTLNNGLTTAGNFTSNADNDSNGVGNFTATTIDAGANTVTLTGANVNSGTSLVANAATLNGIASGSGVTVTTLTITGASASMSGTVNGQVGAAAAALVAMPDAATHLFNGCLVSGCPVAEPPAPPPGDLDAVIVTTTDTGGATTTTDTTTSDTTTDTSTDTSADTGSGDTTTTDTTTTDTTTDTTVATDGDGSSSGALTDSSYDVSAGDELMAIDFGSGLEAFMAALEEDLDEEDLLAGAEGVVDSGLASLAEELGGLLDEYEMVMASTIPEDAFGGKPATIIPGLVRFQPSGEDDEDNENLRGWARLDFVPGGFARFQF